MKKYLLQTKKSVVTDPIVNRQPSPVMSTIAFEPTGERESVPGQPAKAKKETEVVEVLDTGGFFTSHFTKRLQWTEAFLQ